MRLQIAQAVVGNPEPGDELCITFEDGTTQHLEYKPHGSFDRFVWMAYRELPYVRRALKELKRRGIDTGYVTCYADDDHQIVVGRKLHLVLVPRGNMHDWPRFTSDNKIKRVEIQ